MSKRYFIGVAAVTALFIWNNRKVSQIVQSEDTSETEGTCETQDTLTDETQQWLDLP